MNNRNSAIGILVALFVIAAGIGSYVISTSSSPTSNPNPKQPTPQAKSTDNLTHSLQLQTLNFYSPTPETIVPPTDIPITASPTFDCGNANTFHLEPQVFYAYSFGQRYDNKDAGLKFFYGDESPILLGNGSNQVIDDGHISPVNKGNAKNDKHGFPYTPSIYISDITNGSNQKGDLQNGGIANYPSDAYGDLLLAPPPSCTPNSTNGCGFKSYKQNRYPLDFTQFGGDPWPGLPQANGPTGGVGVYTGQTAELVWSKGDMKVSDPANNVGLQSGHTYRAQLIVHDGDFDPDESCLTFKP